jgi:hypothetical protein
MVSDLHPAFQMEDAAVGECGGKAANYAAQRIPRK